MILEELDQLKDYKNNKKENLQLKINECKDAINHYDDSREKELMDYEVAKDIIIRYSIEDLSKKAKNSVELDDTYRNALLIALKCYQDTDGNQNDALKYLESNKNILISYYDFKTYITIMKKGYLRELEDELN